MNFPYQRLSFTFLSNSTPLNWSFLGSIMNNWIKYLFFFSYISILYLHVLCLCESSLSSMVEWIICYKLLLWKHMSLILWIKWRCSFNFVLDYMVLSSFFFKISYQMQYPSIILHAIKHNKEIMPKSFVASLDSQMQTLHKHGPMKEDYEESCNAKDIGISNLLTLF